ncbi:hypothetical protein ACFC06_07845 [Nocardia sp. NPDC056064]|uniref:DUF7832 domain-containing protein n=1 Tax=Nocardia sp. NPDC056064 TaxID=3345701 RepID=UPI0035E26E01
MTYDDASWHSDSVHDLGLDPEAAGTHIAMYMAWLVLHDQATAEMTARAGGLRDRSITPGSFLFDQCAGEIDSSMLTESGAAFTAATYRMYLGAYEYIPGVAAYDPMYSAPDSWEIYDAVAPEITQLHRDWLSLRR